MTKGHQMDVAEPQHNLAPRGTIDIDDDVDTLPSGAPRCTATAKSTGRRCREPAIAGGRVCRVHGGAASQVQRRARLRLAELVDPSIARLGRILVNGTDRDAIRAIENVLDRAGYPRRAEIDVDAARAILRERLIDLRDADAEDDEE